MKILLVDDHKLFREGLAHLLEAGLQEPLTLHQANDCQSALAVAAAHPELDLVLLDLKLPDAYGLSGLQAFTSEFPLLPVLVLSAATHPGDIRQSLECGAMGFVPKDSSSAVVINAIRLVLSGDVYVPPALLRSAEPSKHSSTTSRLTERQQEVMQLMAEGKSNKEIARDLGLAETTIKMHATHIMRMLGVSNRTQAVVKAKRIGLVEPY